MQFVKVRARGNGGHSWYSLCWLVCGGYCGRFKQVPLVHNLQRNNTCGIDFGSRDFLNAFPATFLR